MSKPALKRSLKSAQINMRMMAIRMDGNLASPVATGFDASQIQEIVKNATGDYTIILKTPFEADNAVKAECMAMALETDRAVWMSASDHDRVTVKVTDLAGVAADAALVLHILGQDFRFQH